MTAHFTGRVQGVGFRHGVLQVARGYVVTGTVANLADGRVRLVPEGEGAELIDFLAEVQSSLSSFITQTEQKWETGAPRFSDFVILPGLI